MKMIYVILLFIVFFNIFSFMLGALPLFDTAFAEGNPKYNLSQHENKSAEQIAENATGVGYDDFFKILLGDIDNLADFFLSFGILGGAIALAYVTKSPAPLVIGVVANIMKNTYTSNIEIFNSLEVNNYLMLASMVGMILLFLITCIEYMVSGHGEV
jgi:hypothetical protein